MIFDHHQILAIALAFSSSVFAEDNPAVHGPPEGVSPLTYGFYATPEVREPISLNVTGHIPPWLTGTIYRQAAASFDAGNYSAKHWFDGWDRQHSFVLSNGSVTYRSRNGSDELTAYVAETGHFPGGSFWGDPCKIKLGEYEAIYRDGIESFEGEARSDSVPVAFIANFPQLAQNSTSEGAPFLTLVATTDNTHLKQIDPLTLEPIEQFSYQLGNPDVPTGMRASAHQPPHYRIFTLNPTTGKSEVLADITDAPVAYIHSLFATENYVILTIWQADQTKKAKNVLDSIGDWDPERMSYFYVIDKVNGGVLARHVSEIPFFAFHYMNGYECEETNTIVLDINTYNSTDILFGINIPNFRVNLGNSTEYNPYDTIGDLTRFRLPLPGSGVFNAMSNREEGIAKRDFRIEGRMDLPRINPLFDRKPYRYAYGVHIEKPGYFADSIIKVDIEQKSTKIWMPENMNIVPSEAVMVPRPGGTKEDDGVLLTVVLDDERKLSSLVVLDACSMVEVARAEMPIVMGIGFHGIWGQSDK